MQPRASRPAMRKFSISRSIADLETYRISIEHFELSYLEFPGLNLTFEVREGIIKHSRDISEAEFPDLAEYALADRPPLESQLIDLVDEIAYNSADLDDGYEAHLLDVEMICAGVPLFAEFYKEVDQTHPQGREKLKFNDAVKGLINYLVTDLIENTRREITASGTQTVEDIRRQEKRLVAFSSEAAEQNASLKRFLSAYLYSNPAIAEGRDRSVAALDSLFEFFMENPDRMPKFYSTLAKNEPRHRVVCDYIAGMTDRYVLRRCRDLLGAKAEGAA